MAAKPWPRGAGQGQATGTPRGERGGVEGLEGPPWPRATAKATAVPAFFISGCMHGVACLMRSPRSDKDVAFKGHHWARRRALSSFTLFPMAALSDNHGCAPEVRRVLRSHAYED